MWENFNMVFNQYGGFISLVSLIFWIVICKNTDNIKTSIKNSLGHDDFIGKKQKIKSLSGQKANLRMKVISFLFFEIKKEDNIIELGKYRIEEYNAYACKLDICNKGYAVLYEISESDLDESRGLMRLYRLVEI